jgi:ABC-type lipoprotein export system ATPase subunit
LINGLEEKTIPELFHLYPNAPEFFNSHSLPPPDESLNIGEYFRRLDTDLLEDLGLERNELLERFALFLEHIVELQAGSPLKIQSVTIQGGHDKTGSPDNLILTLKPGDLVCVVGPTGSGKSRLLADIEWMARGDTPTGRHILVNGQTPPLEWRFSLEHKLVAQLSQNMNFVMDLSVNDFIKMHAESRLLNEAEGKIRLILEQANYLAGETFSPETPVTALSGGQSRALMIADAALLSTSPIILIDEIENAGIDRQKALNLLLKEEKIVLMATHDPILALMGQRRIVIKNGGIQAILQVSPQEKANLAELEKYDHKLTLLRNEIRKGRSLDFDLHSFWNSPFNG